MTSSKDHRDIRRSVALFGLVALLATIGILIVRTNASDTVRDRNIAGGGDVAISGAPYQVALISYTVGSNGEADGGALACGGSIIASNWVLTADHCIFRDDNGRMYPSLVRIGSGQSNFWGPYREPARAAVRLVPGRGTPAAWANADLMLIEVDRPFSFSAAVRAVSLPIGFDNATWPAEGSVGLITGWGATLDDAARTTLRGVTMKVNASTDSPYCVDDRVPSVAYYWPSTFVPEQHLCLLRPTNTVNASACSGDSGGPFVVTSADQTVLAGVASKAARDPRALTSGQTVCTGYTPNLYVRVASALDWIVPGRVESLEVDFSGNSANLSWAPPSNPPALAITDYVVEYRVSGSQDWLVLNDGISDVPGATIDGLQDGDNVEVRISGVNAVNELDATMQNSAALNFVFGVAPTTTTSTTTTFTTTTLPPVSTTVAPSTTALRLQIGARPTTTPPSTSTTEPTTVTSRPTELTSVVSEPTTPADAPALKVNGEDPVFAQPTVTLPPRAELPTVTPAVTVQTVTRPAPVVGASLAGPQIAQIARMTVSKGGSIGVSVAKSSSKVCRVVRGSVAFLAPGKCKVTLRVGVGPSSSKKRKKTVTLKVA